MCARVTGFPPWSWCIPTRSYFGRYFFWAVHSNFTTCVCEIVAPVYFARYSIVPAPLLACHRHYVLLQWGNTCRLVFVVVHIMVDHLPHQLNGWGIKNVTLYSCPSKKLGMGTQRAPSKLAIAWTASSFASSVCPNLPRELLASSGATSCEKANSHWSLCLKMAWSN